VHANDPGFAYPQPGWQFVFPRDHGSHPDFKIEWWYITGHLFSKAEPKRRFGFQATFFRQAGSRPGAANSEPPESFAPAPFYLAHMALLDVATQKFIHQERLNRSGWDASSSTETLDVRNGNWSLRFTDTAAERIALTGGIRSEALFHLDLTPAKPLVVFGRDGLSRKGADPLASSHYLTFPRLTAAGTLRVGAEELAVQGEAWMDHEISSSQLTASQVGWDWAALQLRDGREIMAYRMRLEDGGTDPFSTLAWVEPGAPPQHFGPDRFTWKPLATWKSPRTGSSYPTEVQITAPDPRTGRPVVFRLVPLAADQELNGGIGGVAYWEGACRVLDERGAEVGSAFLELTGYAGKLSGVR
jgi:predicted secreted hydrolase